MIKPTIGRVVLLQGRSGSIDARQPEACFVTYVHTDSCINVGGFNANGTPFGTTSIQLLQDDDKPLGSVYAEWMPYQKGQAAKYDELAKEVGKTP